MLRPSPNVLAIARRSLQFVLIAAAIACLTCAPLLAQVTSGTISGTVKDPTGAMVKDATVTLSNPANGLTRTVTTNASGNFVAPNLLPGTYSIAVEAKGFKKSETLGIALSAAAKLDIGDITLTMGAATEQVTVSADAAQIQLQASSGERSDLITSKQLNDVAMNGRNVLDYMKLIPGVVGTTSFDYSGTGGIDGFNINGSRANQHEFTIDGASNVDTGNNGGTHVTLNPDAIEEVKVLTSNYQAEFGKAAGGQVALVTKSGTNQWHGNARFFHRNEGLNANEYFNKTLQLTGGNPNTPPIFRFNNIGYQIGGPIKKDKLFVFWSQEYYRQFVPFTDTVKFYTPTDLERKGDFSQSIDGNGNPVTITGPGVTNNVIDRSQLSPAQQTVFDAVSKILSLYPEPNVSGYGSGSGQNYNYFSVLSGHKPRREDILRVDYQFNNKHRFFGRWVNNWEKDSGPFTSSGLGPYGVFACNSAIQFKGGCSMNHPGWNLSANLVSTFSPTVLNEFSIGPSYTFTDAGGGTISLSANGISLPLLYPTDTIPDMSFNGRANTAFAGGYLGATPWTQANTTINVNDNLTWVRHNHTLKFGFFYQRNRKNQIAWGNVNGQIGFSQGPTSGGGAYTGDPLASALLGSFDSFVQDTARPMGFFRYNQAEFYVQDTWKVTSRLTLDYGMRFAWIPPQYDAKNQVALFIPSAYTGSGVPLDGMRYASNGTLPKGGWDSRGIMPEPRLGFAWDLFGDHKTVLRGGTGMMHDRVQGNLIYNPVFSNPLLVKKSSLGAGNISDLSNPSTGTGVSDNILAAWKTGQVPTVYTYSLGIQREVAPGTTLDLAYVGSLGRHLVTARNLNTIPYGYTFSYAAQDPANYTAYCASPSAGNPCDAQGIPSFEPGLPAEYSAAGFNYSGQFAYGKPNYDDSLLVPYKTYGAIEQLKFDGTSNYNSLQASLQRRFSKGLTAGLVYTWSKSMTTATADEDLQDPFFPRIVNYSAADWDRTHVFAANYVYDLPSITKHHGGPKWLSYITDNYQLSGVTQFMTGAPQKLVDWYATVNGWFEQGAIQGSNFAWENRIPPFVYSIDHAGNPVLPLIGQPNRFPRDAVRTGGMQNWDMSLFKNIPLGSERYSLQLRLEAFNVFNHPNFNNKNYNVSITAPAQWDMYSGYSIAKGSPWGTPNDTYNSTGGPGGPRMLQLAAKFVF